MCVWVYEVVMLLEFFHITTPNIDAYNLEFCTLLPMLKIILLLPKMLDV